MERAKEDVISSNLASFLVVQTSAQASDMNEPDASKYGDNIDTLVVHEHIGKGSYGVVYRSVLKPSVPERAVEIAVAAKVMPLESTDAAIVLREVTLQQQAGSHPSIVAMVGCFHHEGSAAG